MPALLRALPDLFVASRGYKDGWRWSRERATAAELKCLADLRAASSSRYWAISREPTPFWQAILGREPKIGVCTRRYVQNFADGALQAWIAATEGA